MFFFHESIFIGCIQTNLSFDCLKWYHHISDWSTYEYSHVGLCREYELWHFEFRPRFMIHQIYAKRQVYKLFQDNLYWTKFICMQHQRLDFIDDGEKCSFHYHKSIITSSKPLQQLFPPKKTIKESKELSNCSILTFVWPKFHLLFYNKRS